VFTNIFYKHLHIIESFKRFPHRNIVFSRPTSRSEKYFFSVSAHRFDLPIKEAKTGPLEFVAKSDIKK
jgi:hypothetical protein